MWPRELKTRLPNRNLNSSKIHLISASTTTSFKVCSFIDLTTNSTPLNQTFTTLSSSTMTHSLTSIIHLVNNLIRMVQGHLLEHNNRKEATSSSFSNMTRWVVVVLQ